MRLQLPEGARPMKKPRKPEALSKRLSRSEYQELARRQIEAQKKGVQLDVERLVADVKRDSKLQIRAGRFASSRRQEPNQQPRLPDQGGAMADRHRAMVDVIQGYKSNPAMVCPHCQARGQVSIKKIQAKRGISGAKTTGALLTGGLSLLATGLSKKEAATQARCGNCRNEWVF